MKKPTTLNLYGVTGTGSNVTAAKADAGRQIEQMLSGSYTPNLISYRGHSILIWREPTGWIYKTVAEPAEPTLQPTHELLARFSSTQLFGCSSGEASLDATFDSAFHHLAQMTWEPADGNAAPAWLPAKLVDEFRGWAAWQLDFQRLKRTGLTDTECHQQASSRF